MRVTMERCAFALASVVALGLHVGACSSAERESPSSSDASAVPSSSDDASVAAWQDSATETPDVDALDAGDPGPTDASYRNSLRVCWTDPSCARVLAIAHGGDWSSVSGPPYDSNAALSAAYAHGADGVKVDVRVSKDKVPVVAHSSPIELYESLDCAGQKIEEMTAAQVTACHRLPSTTETFQRLDAVLGYLRGRLVAQLNVKLATDLAATIALVNSLGAQDFAFIEIKTAWLSSLSGVAGADKVYYLVNAASSLADVDKVIDAGNARAVMMEFDPGVALGNVVQARLHPAGMRAFTYDDSSSASVAELQALYAKGFEIVSSNVLANTVAARKAVNQQRGVTPP